MSLPFNPWQGLIVIPAKVHGPSAIGFARLAVDTGATTSLIDSGFLSSLGYRVDRAKRNVEMVTASGSEVVAVIEIQQIIALSKERNHFKVLCHVVASNTGIDGVLGLDFLRNSRLTIDFRKGRIALK